MLESSDPRYEQPYTEWLELIRPQCEALAAKHSNTPHLLRGSIDAGAIRAEIASYEDGITILRNMIDMRGSLISPFRLHPLPSEVLERIFELCRLQGPSSLTVVTHVCSLWRHVSIKHRQLWSHIELGTNMKDIDRASMWFGRSQPFPLAIIIRPQVGPHAWAFNQALHAWLRQNALRVESLSLVDTSTVFAHLPPFPLLKSFEILDSEKILSLSHLKHLTDHSPNLTALSISDSQLDHGFVWDGTRITHLCLGNFEQGVPVQEVSARQILSACPNLQSLECHKVSDIFADHLHLLHEEDQDMPLPVTLLSLTEISVGEGTGFRILESLDAPQLRQLRFFGRNKAGPHASQAIMVSEHETLWQSLQALYKTCHPPLTTLIFDHVSEYLTPVFGQVIESICGPTVKELKFDETFMDIGFLCPTDLPEGRRLPFPYLERLSLVSCRYLAAETLSLIITQRNSPLSQPITSLCVKDCSQVYGVDLSVIQQLFRGHQNEEGENSLSRRVASLCMA